MNYLWLLKNLRKHFNRNWKLLKTVTICTLMLMQFQAHAIAAKADSSQKITLKVKELQLTEILDIIKKKSDYSFFYNSKNLVLNQIVSVQLEGKSINEVMDLVLHGTKIDYTILGNQILLTAKTEVAPTTGPISGKITDQQGNPMPGATVVLKGTSVASVTDVDGNFQFKSIPSDGTLVVSFVGMKSQEILVAGNKNINVELKVVAIGIEEVVAIGYGTQKKVNLTGSVTTISTKDLGSRPFASTSLALQGTTSGVTVTNSSGAPGSNGVIRIRGIGTLNDANPLILIDGIEGDINVIDPNIIESITVLKDAASSAIYGSRAANGVILVTTKRAKGEKLSINYNAYIGVQSPMNLPDIVNATDHMEMINLAYKNSGITPIYTEEYIEQYRQNMDSDPDHYPNTDWQKEVLKGSGIIQNHNVTINSGGDKIRLLTSLGYLNQQGLIPISGYDRYTLRNNADIKFSEKLNMKFDFQIIKKNTTSPGTAGEVASDGLSEVFLQMNRIPAIQPGKYSNGLYGEGWNGNNPIAFATKDGGSMTDEHLSLLCSFIINYHPFKWLNAEFLAAPKYNELYTDNFNKTVATYNVDGTPLFLRPEKSTLTNKSNRSFYENYYSALTANKSFNQNEFKLLLGSSLETFDNRNFQAFRYDYTFPQYRVLDAGSQVNMHASGNASEWALQSFFGRLNYDYRSRYLFEANARYDGSSRFATGHKYGFFPSFSLGWRISEESFMENIKSTVDNLKLRGSWGKLGNQNIGTYPFASTLDLGSYSMGGQIVSTAALTNMSNDFISWETSEMINIGLDATLFNNLSLSFDVYDKITSDILLKLDIPLSIGLTKPYQNAGKVRNRGWDIGIGYKGNIREFKFGFDFNISDVENEVLDLKGISNTGLIVNQEGYPINSIYALQADGIFKSDEEIASHAKQIGILAPGDIKYINQNPDVDNIINDDDKVIIGNTIPRYTYGLNLDASFKNFNINAFIQGVGKADGYLYGRAIQPFYSAASAQEQHKDYWTPENQEATFPRLTFGDSGNNYQQSSFWMKDASYLRLKNIQLGYDLPKRLTKTIGLENFRLYINGQNLLTLDNFWNGYDVETPVGTGTNYPQVKVYTMGIDIKF